MAIDAQGTATVAWTRYVGANHYVVQSATRPAGGTWQAPVEVADAGEGGGSLQLAVAPTGDAVATWVGATSAGGYAWFVQAAARTAGGTWQAPANVSGSIFHGYANPTVAMDAHGTATVIWTTSSTLSAGTVGSAVHPSGGTWQAAVDLPGTGTFGAVAPGLSIDAQGNGLALWTSTRRYDSGPALSAERPAGGTWQAPVGIAPGPIGPSARFALDARGNVLATKSGSGPWVSPVLISTAGRGQAETSMAVDGQGRVVAVWIDASATTMVLRSATYDPAYTAPPPAVPAVTGLRLAPSAFRAARLGASVKPAPPRIGTRVSYAIDAPASIRFTVLRARSGRRAGGSCVKPTRATAGLKPCTRFVTVAGHFTRDRPVGRDRFTFSGRLLERSLAPGRYRLVATAIVGGRMGTSGQAAFRIARR